MRFKAIILIFLMLLTIPAISSAKLIDTPEAISYLHAEVSKTGTITLEPLSASSSIESMNISISIPQSNERQKVSLKSVSGADDYRIAKDEWGNNVIELLWQNPSLTRPTKYEVVFDVEVNSLVNKAPGKSFSMTDLIRATESMKQLAYQKTSGLAKDTAMLKLAEWVYNNVEYKLSYANTEKSAEWVFKNKIAVCDGYSNLLISLLRSMGYNAYYVVGYAYTEENSGNYWGPHGWVEAEYDGKVFTLDPTWMESPVDATHIKFGNSPDSNYSEYIYSLGYQVKANWERNDPNIKVIDMQENPRISIETEAFPENFAGSSQNMIKTKITKNTDAECILGKMDIQSCTSSSTKKAFFSIYPELQSYLFCSGSKELYWFLESPEVERSISYTCPINIYGGGFQEVFETNIEYRKDDVDVSISSKKVLDPGEVFDLTTTIKNSGLERQFELFLLFNGKVQKDAINVASGAEEDVIWKLKAPEVKGDYEIIFFSSSGDMIKETFTVTDKNKLRLSEVSAPENIDQGKNIILNVTVFGIEDADGQISVLFNGNEQLKDFSIGKGEEKVFSFTYMPKSPGSVYYSVDVFSGANRYEDGYVDSVFVQSKQPLQNPFDFFSWLVSWLSSLFGG